MLVLVNLKAYDCDPVAVATAAREVADDLDSTSTTDVRVAIAPQSARITPVAELGVEAWAQHVSPTGAGSHTGSARATAASDAGAVGTLLNHSERRLRLADIDAALRQAEEAGLETVVCANNPAQIAAVTALGPAAVAVEPPDLIGSGTPVSQADPDIVREAVTAATEIDPTVPVLCGAGISSGEDVAAAADLGAEGVLVASGVALADDPAAALSELVSEL